MNGSSTLDIPQIWLEAFAFGLALRLALIWAPDKVALMKQFSDEAYSAAAATGIETAQQYLSPTISGYFR